MGYDPIVSSDLVSRVDNSTVFFRKVVFFFLILTIIVTYMLIRIR